MFITHKKLESLTDDMKGELNMYKTLVNTIKLLVQRRDVQNDTFDFAKWPARGVGQDP